MFNRVFFETERLIVTHLNRADFGAIREIQRDAKTMEFFGSKPGMPLTDERIASNFNIIITHCDQFTFSYGPVFEKATGNLIGNAGISHLDFNSEDPTIEIGYLLLPEFWGQGFASELAPLLIEMGLKKFGAPKVVATVDASNVASCNICDKMNMIFEGQFPYATLQGKMLNNYAVYPDWIKPTRVNTPVSGYRNRLPILKSRTVFKYLGSMQDEMFAVPAISLSATSNPELIRSAIDTHNIMLIHTNSDYPDHQKSIREAIDDFPREYLIFSASSCQFNLAAFEATCERLKTDYIDIYYLDSLTEEAVPAVMKTMLDLKKAKRIKAISLSHVDPAVIKAAHAIFPITSVLIDYSLWCCNPSIEEVLETCRALSICCVSTTALPVEDKNLRVLETLAKAENCLPEQLAQAWVLQQGYLIQSTANNSDDLSRDVASGTFKLSVETLNQLNDFSRNTKNL